jgi:4-amino-4-deoxy-L-arabinose transferase-like glycosyltransferase
MDVPWASVPEGIDLELGQSLSLGLIRLLLATFLAICAVLILGMQALSLGNAISVWPVAGIFAAALIAVFWRWPSFDFGGLLLRMLDQPVRPLMWPLLAVMPLLVILSLVLGFHYPPIAWDSMTYHLARAAYWRQWQALIHFPTYDIRQDAFPGNAEVLLLVTLLLVHTAKLAFLVQFIAYLVTAMAVYGLGRHITGSPLYAALGAGIFATMPEVVLESASTQNDLLVAAFVTCGTFFVVDTIDHYRPSGLLLIGMAFGLGLGVKPTAALALPGIGLGAVAVLWTMRSRVRLVGTQIGVGILAVAGAALLCVPWYLANQKDYGQLGGPASLTQLQMVAHPTLDTLRVNLLRHFIAFIDPSGPVLLTANTTSAACTAATNLHSWLVTATHVPLVLPAIDVPGSPYSPAPACVFNEDMTWFGLGGLFVVLCAVGFLLNGLVRRKFDFTWLLAAAALSYLFFAALLLRWQSYEGRVMVPMLALAAPLGGLFIRKLRRIRLVRWILLLCALYLAIGGLAAEAKNSAMPLQGWGASQLVAQTRTQPAIEPILAAVKRSVPQNAHMAIFVGDNDWEFPLFGDQLNRVIMPLVFSAAGRLQTERVVGVTYLLTHRSADDVTRFLTTLQPITFTEVWHIDLPGTGGRWTLFRGNAPAATLARYVEAYHGSIA